MGSISNPLSPLPLGDYSDVTSMLIKKSHFLLKGKMLHILHLEMANIVSDELLSVLLVIILDKTNKERATPAL